MTPGSTRSVRTTAILQEAVADGTVDVLLVKAQSASGSQLVTNNVLRSDKFAVLAVATISWVLLDSRAAAQGHRGEIRDAGLATGVSQVHGELGKALPAPE